MKVWFITAGAVELLVGRESNVSLLLSLNCNILLVLVSGCMAALPLMVLLMTAGPGGSEQSHSNLQLSGRSLMVLASQSTTVLGLHIEPNGIR